MQPTYPFILDIEPELAALHLRDLEELIRVLVKERNTLIETSKVQVKLLDDDLDILRSEASAYRSVSARGRQK